MVSRAEEPFDRLTHLSVRMTEPLEEQENHDVKAIVFLRDDHHGGIQLHGYEDEIKAMADLLIHLQAIFKAAGKRLEFVAIPETPEGAE